MKNSCFISSKRVVLLGNVASMMLNFREQLIKDLVTQGCEVYCLAQRYTEKDKEVLSDWGAIAIDSPLNAKGLNPINDMFAVIKLIKLLKSIAPDVVFSCFVKPVIFGTLSAKFAKVPRVIGMIEGLGNAFTSHKEIVNQKTKIIQLIQVILYKISLPRLDCLILLNQDDKKDLLDTHHIKVKRLEIVNGIGLDLDHFQFSHSPTEKISFIFIGRFLKEKGIFEYLEAAEAIKKNYPDVVFYMLGEFDEGNPFALKQSVLNMYLQNETVIYPGYVDNVPDWITKSSVFVLPSYREGLPRSTQEAMAIGRPIITTDVVGCRETVTDGVNGFLVPAFSSDALVEKIRFFIENPQKINAMGEKSRKMAEQKYDVKKVNKRLMKILFNEHTENNEGCI